MIKPLTISNKIEAHAVLDIQLKAYQIEADLIGFPDLPPLKESIMDLQKSEETFYGYFTQEERLAGVISYKVEGNVLDIHRMMVHPDYFRRGIASSLLSFIETAESDIHEITVATGSKNDPAIKLYQRHGYFKIKEKRLDEGISLIFFKKYLGFD